MVVVYKLFIFLAAIIDNEYRPKPTGEGGKCGAIGQFIFDWESVANITSVSLNRSIIRSYVQVINRLIDDNEVIPVNVSISLQLFHKNMTANETEQPHPSSKFQHVATINVTSESDGWLELDITSSLLSVWSPSCKQLPIIEVTLRMEVDCLTHKKVPFQFINPAEVELFKTFRRQKYTKLQTLLLVYIEDQDVKQKLKEEEKLKKEEVKDTIDGLDVSKNTQHGENRRKKQASICERQNFVVNFTQLFLNNIAWPSVMNIGQCAGDCTHYGITGHNLATNHARLISNAKYLDDNDAFFTKNETMFYQHHKNACCTPIRYASVYMILYIEGAGYKSQLFSNMKVTECSCR